MRRLSVPIRSIAAVQRLGVRETAGPVQVRIAAHGGERRPQLVRGVGDEPPELALAALLRLEGPLLLAERGLDLVQHRVERGPEPPDLGPVVGDAGAVREVAGRDLLGGAGDPLQRQEAVPDQQPRDREQGRHRDRAHDEHRPDQGALGASVTLVIGAATATIRFVRSPCPMSTR